MNLSLSEVRELLCLSSAPQPGPAAREAKLQIAVLDRGWVFVGRCSYDGDLLVIDNARCVRVWGTTRGLGEIALNGPTGKTVLDSAGRVTTNGRSVVCLIDCKESSWKE